MRRATLESASVPGLTGFCPVNGRLPGRASRAGGLEQRYLEQKGEEPRRDGEEIPWGGGVIFFLSLSLFSLLSAQ